MKKISILLLAFCSISTFLFAQSHTLELAPENWKINGKGYYIKEIRDNRPSKDDGKVMKNGKIVPVKFKSGMIEDFTYIIQNSATFDTSGVPIVLIIDKMKYNETGTLARHKATLNFAIHFSSFIDGEEYKLFTMSGTPAMQMTGNVKDGNEKSTMSTLKQTIKGFDEWIQSNLNIPPLAQKVELKFIDSLEVRENNNDSIFWSPDYKLTWADFKGTAPVTDFAAESNCSFAFSQEKVISNGVMTLNARFHALFLKRTSWVKPDSKQDSLLIHEQYHFNICEMFARECKRRLYQVKFNPMKCDEQVKLIFDEVWAEYKIAQATYDEETQHGIILPEQNKWIKKVDENL